MSNAKSYRSFLAAKVNGAAVATKEAFQRRMINAIERGDNFGLEGWTDCELHDLAFAADLLGAPIAQAEVQAELGRRA